MTLMHKDVKRAVELAAQAKPKWPVETDKGFLFILPPDGSRLKVAMRPDEEALEKWRSACRRYQLDGDGPAMTPAQQEEAKKMAEAKPAPDPVQAKKMAETKAAQKKAEAVVKAAAALPTPPPSPSQPVPPVIPAIVPVVTHTKATPATIAAKAKAAGTAPAVKRDKFGFPPFTPEMLVLKEYSPVKLPGGQYFCPECWSVGERALFKQPQGVASHRGFKHALFSKVDDTQGDSKVVLPETLLTALELLHHEMVEVYASVADTAEAETLKAKITELEKVIEDQKKTIAERDDRIKNLGADLDKAIQNRDLATKLANERGVFIEGTQARHDREVKAVMEKVGKDFVQFREWINTLTPARATARIDEAMDKYLGE